ncbi:MAG: hypothetical protein HY906_17015 [Deltaproteobacteria bacterium]|nr:hypothetical protein [Deltaproteobacteria bacterium]
MWTIALSHQRPRASVRDECTARAAECHVRFGLSVALLALAGCISHPMLQTARTLDEGSFQVALGLHAGQAERVSWSPSGSSRSTWVFPGGALSFRYGLLPRVDVGLQTGSHAALLLDAKVQVVRSRVFDLSIAPGGGLTSTSTGDVRGYPALAATLVLFAGLNLGERVTIVLAPGSFAKFPWVLHLGGGLGIAIVVTDWLTVMPEANALAQVDGQWRDRPWAVQGGFALIFGGRKCAANGKPPRGLR